MKRRQPTRRRKIIRCENKHCGKEIIPPNTPKRSGKKLICKECDETEIRNQTRREVYPPRRVKRESPY